MKYIPDKQLFKAVMFALNMCSHSLNYARDEKIKIAADYYKVNESDVFEIVKKELWDLKFKECKGQKNYVTIFNPYALKLLGQNFGNDYLVICPKCHNVRACNVNSYMVDELLISACPDCEFVDYEQRNFVRKRLYDYKKENGLI